MKGFAAALLVLFFASSAHAFAPQATQERASVSLQAAKSDHHGMQKVAFSAVAAAFLAANVAATPALAVDNSLDMFGSSQVVAARSGGRAGGRASSGGASYSRPSSSSSNTYRSYRSSTTIVAPPVAPSIIVAPPVTYGYGYGYNPLGGIATGMAINSIGNIGNDIRDARQEGEIQRSRAELQQSKMKEAELEARLRQLEAAQMAK